jgi:hypothetical protein
MEDAAFVVNMVKFGAIWGGAPADSKKYFAGGQHAISLTAHPIRDRHICYKLRCVYKPT